MPKPKRRTKREALKSFRHWAKVLGMHEWSFTLYWDVKELVDEGASAKVWVPDHYHHVEIALAPNWRDWETRELHRIFIHELMHVLLRDLTHITEHIAASVVDKQAMDVLRASALHAEEGFVERLAQRLVDNVAWPK